MNKYSVIAEQENCTVVGHYEAQPRQQTAYQSEAALEDGLLKQLVEQGYEYLKIHTEEAQRHQSLRHRVATTEGDDLQRPDDH